MAVITFYKAVDSATDGSKGVQVTSGQVDAIFPYLTSQNRISGITQLEKFYVQSDVGIDIYIGFTNLGLFNTTMIDSTGVIEVSGDVSGASPRYGSSEILANDANGCTIKHNAINDLFRVNDFILIGSVVAQIATITDNTTDRVITYVFAVEYVDAVGTFATSLIQKTLTANVGTPLWGEKTVQAGASATQTYDTVPVVVVS